MFIMDVMYRDGERGGEEMEKGPMVCMTFMELRGAVALRLKLTPLKWGRVQREKNGFLVFISREGGFSGTTGLLALQVHACIAAPTRT